MSTCGTCAHWREPDGWYGSELRAEGADDPLEWDHAASVALNRLYRPCQRITMPDWSERLTPETAPIAYTMDGSEYRADLMTRAEFGCGLWESA